MTRKRLIDEVLASRPAMEGAGVRLKRAFGFDEVPRFDPFLLLDDFHSDDPADYVAGFPWHPHRGIETVSYLLEGRIRHGDSLGNRGVIGAGGIQWMTAGRGIVHEEMPEQTDGKLWGFQLWVNLPAARKMMAPRYQDIDPGDVPVVERGDGSAIRVLAGEVDGRRGPVRDVVAEPAYLDVSLVAGGRWSHPTPAGHTVLAYVIGGSGTFADGSDPVAREHLIAFGPGDGVGVAAGDDGVRFLLVAGQPLGEPVAWQGPIVMNTEQELRTAFAQYASGTFLDG